MNSDAGQGTRPAAGQTIGKRRPEVARTIGLRVLHGAGAYPYRRMATSSVRGADGGMATWPHWRAIRDALTLAGLLYIAAVWLGIAPYAPPIPEYGPMFDARAYWTAWEGGMYDTPWLVNGAYSYSPAFAQLIWPFTLLPWPVFAAAWTLGSIGCLFWMRVPWMIAFPGVIDDILRGNIHVFLAAAIVLAIRGFPAAWTFGIITKVTPGIGILWHVVRAEWRNTAIAVGVPFAIVAVSFAVSSELWFQWLDFLAESAGGRPESASFRYHFSFVCPSRPSWSRSRVGQIAPGSCRSGS